jgi:LysR family transcriptional regulator, glycine cleavage system transcriptional activator
MGRRLPPLTELRAFEAVARHSSFKKAAAELAVTPTAISHQIQLLETFCGQSLLRRRPRPVTLTPAGARLYPVLRQGLDAFASAVAELLEADAEQTLTVTTTNAFASRWLVPRLPSWRRRYPGIHLEVIGTDAVMDLADGEADLAIRYMYEAPRDLAATELLRDEFFPVCSPTLLSDGAPIERLAELTKHTLIHCYWSPADPHAPTWSRWLEAAASISPPAPKLSELQQLTFREELHAIDAALAEQGILIVSDLLVARELEEGRLVKAVNISLPGYGFYLVHQTEHPREQLIELFMAWALSMR